MGWPPVKLDSLCTCVDRVSVHMQVCMQSWSLRGEWQPGIWQIASPIYAFLLPLLAFSSQSISVSLQSQTIHCCSFFSVLTDHKAATQMRIFRPSTQYHLLIHTCSEVDTAEREAKTAVHISKALGTKRKCSLPGTPAMLLWAQLFKWGRGNVLGSYILVRSREVAGSLIGGMGV